MNALMQPSFCLLLNFGYDAIFSYMITYWFFGTGPLCHSLHKLEK